MREGHVTADAVAVRVILLQPGGHVGRRDAGDLDIGCGAVQVLAVTRPAHLAVVGGAAMAACDNHRHAELFADVLQYRDKFRRHVSQPAAAAAGEFTAGEMGG